MAIKGKRNINLTIGDKVLRLLDALYVLRFIVNFISTTMLWRNDIGVYFPASQYAELFFNGIIFAYADNMRNQFILWQFKE